MKLLLISFISVCMLADTTYDDLLDYTGISINVNNNQQVTLETAKCGESTTSGIKIVKALKVKGSESTVKLHKSDIKDFVIKFGKSDIGEIHLLKFEQDKDNRIAEEIIAIKAESNKNFVVVGVGKESINSKQRIAEFNLNVDHLENGNYGFVLKRNGTSYVGGKAIMFDLID